MKNLAIFFVENLTIMAKKINKFQKAILKLGITPNHIIAFENEESEIADAREAGITIINPIII